MNLWTTVLPPLAFSSPQAARPQRRKYFYESDALRGELVRNTGYSSIERFKVRVADTRQLVTCGSPRISSIALRPFSARLSKFSPWPRSYSNYALSLAHRTTAEANFLVQFLEPPRQKTALRFLPRRGERLLIRRTGLRNPPGAAWWSYKPDLRGRPTPPTGVVVATFWKPAISGLACVMEFFTAGSVSDAS